MLPYLGKRSNPFLLTAKKLSFGCTLHVRLIGSIQTLPIQVKASQRRSFLIRASRARSHYQALCCTSCSAGAPYKEMLPYLGKRSNPFLLTAKKLSFGCTLHVRLIGSIQTLPIQVKASQRRSFLIRASRARSHYQALCCTSCSAGAPYLAMLPYLGKPSNPFLFRATKLSFGCILHVGRKSI